MNAIAFAERVVALLDEGAFTATYKYAVLLGLLDVVMERTSATGEPPSVVTTRQLTEKVTELYWPQADAFGGGWWCTCSGKGIRSRCAWQPCS